MVVRVSEKGDREDEHFHSPEVQIEAATRWAKDRGERLAVAPIPEIDVSGSLPLSKRPGLLAAIEMIEAGQADQLVVAYFDRLVPSPKVPLEVIERVERAGRSSRSITASSRTARRRSASRRTCSARCSNTLPRSRARRSRRPRRGRWRGGSTRTRGSRSGTCAARTAC
jgi:DNA invertase Pin-like site-specific DNA recombinase